MYIYIKSQIIKYASLINYYIPSRPKTSLLSLLRFNISHDTCSFSSSSPFCPESLLVHITKKEHRRQSTTDLGDRRYPFWAAHRPAHCVAAWPLEVARW